MLSLSRPVLSRPSGSKSLRRRWASNFAQSNPLDASVLLSDANRERTLAKMVATKPLRQTRPEIQTRSAAVLVPIFQFQGEVCLLYTLRARSMRKHGGEISFPGGNADQEETPVMTAVRETTEELGISADKIQVWGKMAPISDKSGTLDVHPVVGFVDMDNVRQSDLSLSKAEVSLAFLKSVKSLTDPKICRWGTIIYLTMRQIYQGFLFVL